MPAILVTNYQNIANFYTNAEITVSGVVSYYFDAAYEIVVLQVFDPEIDLLSPFYNAYLSADVIYKRAPQATIQAVAALQAHVLNRAKATDGTTKFANINEWLDADNSFGVSGTNLGRSGDTNDAITVPAEFANLSSQAGYSINVALQT